MEKHKAGTTPTMPDPASIMQLSTAYWGSQTLLTANRMGLFELLGKNAMSAREVADKLGTQVRSTELLLSACVALGLLQRTDGGYTVSPAALAFLVPGSPGYLGNAIRYSDNLYQTWGNLEKALHEGTPPMAPEKYTGGDEQKTRDFVYGMHDRALGIGRVLVELVDLAGRRQMLDVGGGPGTYASLFAQRYPELRCRVLDLPGVAAIADEIIESLGVADRVTPLPGHYLESEYPKGNDVVLISGVFHRETEGDCRGLIERARDCLEPGGLLIISDVFTDADGTGPPFATLFGLNMMLTAPNGGVHSDSNVARWLTDAGFENLQTRLFPPPMPHRLVMGKI